MSIEYKFLSPFHFTTVDCETLVYPSSSIFDALVEAVENEYVDLTEYMDEPLASKIETILLNPTYDNLRFDNIYMLTTVVAKEELSEKEIKEVKDYISGQFSDGWGEGFEQREIEVKPGYGGKGYEIYASPWSFDDNWYIERIEK